MQDNKDISETYHNHWHDSLIVNESELTNYKGCQAELLLGGFGDEEDDEKKYIVYLPTPPPPTDSDDD
jgi:hypothetical protein